MTKIHISYPFSYLQIWKV